MKNYLACAVLLTACSSADLGSLPSEEVGSESSPILVDGKWGWVWDADKTNPSYTPPAQYAANSSGAINTILRFDDGEYYVVMPSLGTGTGNAIVSAHGTTDNTYCSLSGWGVGQDILSFRHPDGGMYARTASLVAANGNLVIGVACTDSLGGEADSAFTVDYIDRPALGGQVAYAEVSWNGTIVAAHAYNSAGQTNTVTHPQTGAYTVTLPGMASSVHGGNVLVSAMHSPAHCNVSGWGPNADGSITASVKCWSPAGAAADADFSIRYGVDASITAASEGYGWGSNATAASYTLDTFYSNTVRGNPKGGPGTTIALPIVSTRTAVGSYLIDVPALPATHSTALAQMFGASPGYCKVGSWVAVAIAGSRTPGTRIPIQCFNGAGNAADSRLVYSYGSTILPLQ